MSKVYLAPAEGLSIPLPDGKPWPAEGAYVELTEFVRRRLADRDLVEATPPKVEEAKAQEVASAAEPSPAEPATEGPQDAEAEADATKPSRRRTRS